MSFSVSRSAALLLCCSAAGSRKALQLYLWQSRYRKTRAVSSYLCDSRGRCFCVYVCVRVSVRVSVVCAVIGAQNDQEQRRINFVKSSRSAVRPLHQYECTSAVQQQRYDGSRVPQAVAFVPVVKVYMCVVGDQQEIEPPQHFHVQRNNQNTRCRTSHQIHEAYSSSEQ